MISLLGLVAIIVLVGLTVGALLALAISLFSYLMERKRL